LRACRYAVSRRNGAGNVSCPKIKEFIVKLHRIIDAIKYRLKRPVRVTLSRHVDLSCWLDLWSGAIVRINGKDYEILSTNEYAIRAVAHDAAHEADPDYRNKDEPTVIDWGDIRTLHIP
jgi:hypothetical protein